MVLSPPCRAVESLDSFHNYLPTDTTGTIAAVLGFLTKLYYLPVDEGSNVEHDVDSGNALSLSKEVYASIVVPHVVYLSFCSIS